MRIVAKPRSMFTCLYIESLIGLIITFALFSHFGSGYMRQADLDIFVDDGMHHVQHYINTRYDSDGLHHKLNKFRELTFFDYKLSLVSNWNESKSLCGDCSVYTSSQGVRIFVDEDELLRTALPLPNSTAHLVFQEIDDPFNTTTPWYEDQEIHFMLSLFVTMSVALGLLIYLPLYRVNKRVNRLIQVQERFGRGDLSARAETYHISPVKELSQSFNEMAEDIELKVKQNQIFAHAVPHEIRTPLSKIQMASDLARREDCSNREQLFNDIDDYIEDISDLTSDILQLAKLNGKPDLDLPSADNKVSLGELCRNRLDMIASNQTRLIVAPDVEQDEVILSTTLAKLVLDNLIKNADRYGNGLIEVTVHEYVACWTIDVEDNGEGIPLDKRQEIFMAFSRLDKSRNARDGGFGLGLAIAKNAARKLNWRLSVDDSHLGGARFTVVIDK
ncbi:signal transduction histidine kinase [Vibrio sinaloensis DSM 21326]|uniref:histidine kinase n=1 Tax=Vibrio sinaloensis DSM 21326 TaxID=945550 RepID=E8M873_PHOS4|nr:HAMP domain-containing sensor histidine kinase [Vibrio sinaloensis]EGA69765.1 signal transduction histidine kinase [Vibrio sinaloensis DSM 21326]